MKVVHVIKRIEMIDNDVKELKKLEKSVAANKSFSTPIYMSIEKQINILLGERIKLLELKIDNPPDYMVEEIEGKRPESLEEESAPAKKKTAKKTASKKKTSKKRTAKKTAKQMEDMDDDDIPMLTQDQIDARFDSMQDDAKAKSKEKSQEAEKTETGNAEDNDENDDNVKLLDIALEKGTLEKEEGDKTKEKKVRFFRENFPVD